MQSKEPDPKHAQLSNQKKNKTYKQCFGSGSGFMLLLMSLEIIINVMDSCFYLKRVLINTD